MAAGHYLDARTGDPGINQRLGTILDDRRIGLWEWDVATGRVTGSPCFEFLHYLVPGTLPKTYEGLLRLVHPDDRERFAAAVSQAVEHMKEFSVEYRIIAPSKSE